MQAEWHTVLRLAVVETRQVEGRIVGYWRGIFQKTAKRAADTLRIASAGSVVALLFGQAVIAVVLLYFTSVAGAALPTRIASAAAPFLMFPAFFVALLPVVIAEADAARRAEIEALEERVAELETEDHSDATLRLEPEYAVFAGYGFPSAMHVYQVAVENTGPNHLLNCVLKTGTMNQLNADIHNRAWLRTASPAFELRLEEIVIFDVLWIVGDDPTAPAYPCSYNADPEAPRPGHPRYEGEIISTDQTCYLHAEVLSANTPPARLTLRLWNDNGWHVEALAPGERPVFPDD